MGITLPYLTLGTVVFAQLTGLHLYPTWIALPSIPLSHVWVFVSVIPTSRPLSADCAGKLERRRWPCEPARAWAMLYAD